MFVSKIITDGSPGLCSFLGLLAIVCAYILTTLLKRAHIDLIVTIINVYPTKLKNMSHLTLDKIKKSGARLYIHRFLFT